MPTTNTIDRELTEAELDHVTGGFTATEHGSITTTKLSGWVCDASAGDPVCTQK